LAILNNLFFMFKCNICICAQWQNSALILNRKKEIKFDNRQSPRHFNQSHISCFFSCVHWVQLTWEIWPKPGYASIITCSTISNISYNLFFATKFNDSSILITIISCDYLNLSLADEHVGDVTIPTHVKY
jgi:hypothetical protein